MKTTKIDTQDLALILQGYGVSEIESHRMPNIDVLYCAPPGRGKMRRNNRFCLVHGLQGGRGQPKMCKQLVAVDSGQFVVCGQPLTVESNPFFKDSLKWQVFHGIPIVNAEFYRQYKARQLGCNPQDVDVSKLPNGTIRNGCIKKSASSPHATLVIEPTGRGRKFYTWQGRPMSNLQALALETFIPGKDKTGPIPVLQLRLDRIREISIAGKTYRM